MNPLKEQVKLNREIVTKASDELGIPEEKIPVLVEKMLQNDKSREMLFKALGEFVGRRAFLGSMAGFGAAALGMGIAGAKTVISDNNVIIDDQWYLKSPAPFSALTGIDGTKVIAYDWKGKEIASGVAGTDDASVIQSALDVGGNIFIHEGEYLIDTPIVWNPNANIYGVKPRIDIANGYILESGTILKANATIEAILVANENIFSKNIMHIGIDCNSKADYGIYAKDGFAKSNIEDCLILRHNIAGIKIEAAATSQDYEPTIVNNHIIGKATTGSTYGIYIEYPVESGMMLFNRVHGCVTGIYCNGPDWLIEGNHVYKAPASSIDYCIHIGNINAVRLIGNILGACTKSVIRLDGTTEAQIEGNRITGISGTTVAGIEFVQPAGADVLHPTIVGNLIKDVTYGIYINGGTGEFYNPLLDNTYRNVTYITTAPKATHFVELVRNINGNAGTAYSAIEASRIRFDRANYKYINYAELVVYWDPATTSGGLELVNATDGVVVVTLEPGTTGLRWDKNDITSHLDSLPKNAEKVFVLKIKGDGTTAPKIEAAYIKLVEGMA